MISVYKVHVLLFLVFFSLCNVLLAPPPSSLFIIIVIIIISLLCSLRI